jgi:hypothetical protein
MNSQRKAFDRVMNTKLVFCNSLVQTLQDMIDMINAQTSYDEMNTFKLRNDYDDLHAEYERLQKDYDVIFKELQNLKLNDHTKDPYLWPSLKQ